MAHVEIECTSCDWEGTMVEEKFWNRKKDSNDDVGVACPECGEECDKK